MIRMIFACEKETGLIGKCGTLPWHFSEDLKFFKEQTINKLVICGSTTFKSLPKLKDRNLYVCTSDVEVGKKAIESEAGVIFDLEGFLKEPGSSCDVYIIGGAKIYEAAKKYADELVVTEIALKDGKHFTGDAYIFDFAKEFEKHEVIACKECINKSSDEFDGQVAVLEWSIWRKKPL